MANRMQIPFAVETFEELSGKKVAVPVVGASITITNRETSSAASVFETEAGGSTIIPTTDANGRIVGWLEENPYNIVATGGTPAIAPTSFAWDAVTGKGVGRIGIKAVKTIDLEEEAVTTEKIAPKAVTDAKVATNRALVTTNNSYVNKTFTKAEIEAGIEPSSSRMAIVVVKLLAITSIGGVAVLIGENTPFLVPPGQKWKSNPAGASYETWTLLL